MDKLTERIVMERIDLLCIKVMWQRADLLQLRAKIWDLGRRIKQLKTGGVN